jgi:hypothetical protein
MFSSHAQRSLWPVVVIAALGAALLSQACSGRVQESSDCPSGSSCAGAGAGGGAGAKAEAGSSAFGGSAAGNAALEACANATKDADESDVDCGGASKCERCAENSRCTINEDCESDFCKSNQCTEPTCADRIKNQNETDVDCGGSCQPCPMKTPCLRNEDCSDQYCAKGVCSDHCLSGLREADETDKDCGGATCKACPDNRRCVVASDCQSLVCSNNSCRAASCSDQLENQDESDIDCGGVCSASKRCPLDARCNTESDCQSWICSATGKCLADIEISPADVIDDFEDGDLLLPASPALGGRVGNWYAFDDGSGIGSLKSFAIERGASVNGLRATGKGFEHWGSGFGVDLNNSTAGQTSKVPYDATAYAGITFWARAQSTTTVKVALPDLDTDAAGELCASCAHHYYKLVQLTTKWQRFTVAFSELVLESGGVPIPTAFKPSGVFSVQFMFEPGLSYDLYLDDLAFLKN